MKTLLALALLLAVPAWGQTIPPEQILLSQLDQVRHDFPAGWTFTVMDQATWENHTHKTHIHTAFTDLAKKATYINEGYILTAKPEKLRHTLLHEAGHVSCRCWDEAWAEHFAVTH